LPIGSRVAIDEVNLYVFPPALYSTTGAYIVTVLPRRMPPEVSDTPTIVPSAFAPK
jgi:hypothetical protein